MAGEGNRSRRKGRDGEAEVAAIWREHGFDVRGLEGEGDHTLVRPEIASASYWRAPALLHSEVKRCERVRIVEWVAQTDREAPVGVVPVLAWRRSRERWRADLPLEDLARLLA